MSDIAEFLNAQYDEAERAARQVRQPYRLYVSSEGRISEPKRVDDLHGERDGEYEQQADGGDRMPNDIANWSLIYDPAVVLADIESKRKILAEHQPDGEHLPYEDGTPACGRCGDYGMVEWPCLTVRLLAAPFSAEPGYDAEKWAV